MQFKRAIEDIDQSALSPNLVEINRHLKKTKDLLDLRQDDSKQSMAMSQTMDQSPKRLQINSPERFDSQFDQTQQMQNDRYQFAKTTRNKDKGRHPPRISPRASHKSVDPLTRKANQSYNNTPMKSTGGFGPTIRNAFSSKKQSLQLQHQSQDQSYAGLTSKYHTGSEPVIEVDVKSPEPRKKTMSKIKLKAAKREDPQDSPSSIQKSGGQFNFSRSKNQNVTGFTYESVETGAIAGSKLQTPLAHRKTSMLPDISQVQQFYEQP